MRRGGRPDVLLCVLWLHTPTLLLIPKLAASFEGGLIISYLSSQTYLTSVYLSNIKIVKVLHFDIFVHCHARGVWRRSNPGNPHLLLRSLSCHSVPSCRPRFPHCHPRAGRYINPDGCLIEKEGVRCGIEYLIKRDLCQR